MEFGGAVVAALHEFDVFLREGEGLGVLIQALAAEVEGFDLGEGAQAAEDGFEAEVVVFVVGEVFEVAEEFGAEGGKIVGSRGAGVGGGDSSGPRPCASGDLRSLRRTPYARATLDTS